MNPIRIMPMPGQESVWDYPHPPRVENSIKQIAVVFNGVVIARTRRARRVLETSHPPVYYIPPEDVQMEHLAPSDMTTRCEFRGSSVFRTVAVGDKTAEDAAWFHPAPAPGYEDIKGYIAFVPGKMDACYVNGEKATPQSGEGNSGWITKDILGPFKGDPGTTEWD